MSETQDFNEIHQLSNFDTDHFSEILLESQFFNTEEQVFY
jgi:hypothetical protein